MGGEIGDPAGLVELVHAPERAGGEGKLAQVGSVEGIARARLLASGDGLGSQRR